MDLSEWLQSLKAIMSYLNVPTGHPLQKMFLVDRIIHSMDFSWLLYSATFFCFCSIHLW